MSDGTITLSCVPCEEKGDGIIIIVNSEAEAINYGWQCHDGDWLCANCVERAYEQNQLRKMR
jgi:hypothetical protein